MSIRWKSRLGWLVSASVALTTSGCAKRTCAPPFSYDALDFSIDGEYQEATVQAEMARRNLREVDALVEQHSGQFDSLCRSFEIGGITEEEYAKELARMNAHFRRLQEMQMRLRGAKSLSDVVEIAAQTYNAAIEGVSGDLEVSVSVYVQRPGDPGFTLAPEGAVLGTGTRTYLEVTASAPSYLYLYQIKADGALTVIFPDEQIPIPPQLEAGSTTRIPHERFTFDVDDRDLGLENLHIVVSERALEDLRTSAAREASEGKKASDDLNCGTRGLELSEPPTCNSTRGLKLSAAGAGAASESLEVVAVAGDDAVHIVYTFHHVGDPERFARKNSRGLEALSGDAAQSNRQSDISACPGDAELKHMEVDGGALERWCADLSSTGAFVGNGPYRKWYPNGRLWVEGQHAFGERVGTWRTFDAQGSELATHTY